MSLQDQIVIKSDVDPKSTLKFLVASMGITDEPYDVKSHPLMPVVGITGTTWNAHTNEMKDPYRSFVNEVVGFPSNVDISIFFVKEKFRTARLEWFKAVLDVLKKQSGI